MATEVAGFTAVPLRDERARDPRTSDAKAANLARALHAGLPVLPGFVLVPHERQPGAAGVREMDGPWGSWRELTEDGGRPVVARSSSADEDTEGSSMAGRYESVLDVGGWEAFTAAVRTVTASGASGSGDAGGTGPATAVLVQPMLRAAAGGVLFGADPVTGRTEWFLVSAVRGGPHDPVAGRTRGTVYRLTRHGRPVAWSRPAPRTPARSGPAG